MKKPNHNSYYFYMANISYPSGNIFDSSSQTIVNTVNCVGVMGKGIALEYKIRYPEMYESYKKICDTNNLQIGMLHLWKGENKWVLNFPTKTHYSLPSELNFIKKGLKKFVDTYKAKGITSIAFPQLGSSLGGLDWEGQVKPLLLDYLSDLPDIDIELYSYDPSKKDNDFIKLLTKTNRYELEDYINIIGLNKKQSEVLKNALDNNKIKNTIGIQSLEGFGEKSLIKVRNFIESDHVETPMGDLNPKIPGLNIED